MTDSSSENSSQHSLEFLPRQVKNNKKTLHFEEEEGFTDSDDDFDEHEKVKSPRQRMNVLKMQRGRQNMTTNVDHRGYSIRSFGNYLIEDHFGLVRPSSDLYLRRSDSHIFPLGNQALVLEHQKNSQLISVKHFRDGTPGLYLIRGAYTMIALLMLGFLFVFCLQVILFLFLGLAIQSGFTSQKDFGVGSALLFLGTACAIPVLLEGLAHGMSIGSAFIADTWNGNMLIKTVLRSDSVIIDWISTTLYVTIPVVFGAISTASGSPFWWSNTLLVWFSCLSIYYVGFAVIVIYFEISGGIELMSFHHIVQTPIGTTPQQLTSRSLAYHSILLKMRQSTAGIELIDYVSTGEDLPGGEESYDEAKQHEGNVSSIGLFSRVTILLSSCCPSLYTKLPKPKFQFDEDQVFEHQPITTKSSWSLEKFYCRNRDQSHTIMIAKGKAAITKEQATSSFLCFCLSFVLRASALISIAIWMHLNPVVIALLCLFYIVYSIRSINGVVWLRKRSLKFHNQVLEDIKDNSITYSEKNTGDVILYQSRLKFQVTQASDSFCVALFVAEIIFFFLVPVASLVVMENYPVASLFVVVALVKFGRGYFNCSSLLRETGSLDALEINSSSRDEEWRRKNRLFQTVTFISSGENNAFWRRIFTGLIVGFCLVFMSAVILGSRDGRDFSFKYSGDFEFPGNQSAKYPSCNLGQDFAPPDGSTTALSDFTFLAGVAYHKPELIEESLNMWFNGTNTVNHRDIVVAFREEYENGNLQSAVDYAFIGFPDEDVGVVTIRGTRAIWDVVSDIQLWAGAGVSQIVRGALPFGNVFTPVFRSLIKATSIIESSSLEKVSYYQQTSDFVFHVKELNIYKNIVITGHSLGGGLAMITGAQTHIPSIGISGPNAMLSRSTFDPPITAEELNKYTFNIIPDRDVFAMLDDVAHNSQRINCNAASHAFMDCHADQRTVCEVLYACGSRGRPIPCSCFEKFGYQEPKAIEASSNEKSFAEFCSSDDGKMI